MGFTDNQVEKAISNLKGKARIVREFQGFIVLAQSENDFRGKADRISNGDVKGFYTIESALNLTQRAQP